MSNIYKSGREFIFEGVELLPGSFRNFAGEKRRFNDAGQRFFNVSIQPDYIQFLINEGVNVKYFKADLDDEEQEDLPGFVRVKVNYGGRRDPELLVRYGNNGRFSDFGQDQIKLLDTAVFDTVDLVINPSHYDVNGQSGTSLYLQKGYFTLHVDPLAAKYEQMLTAAPDAETEDLPF